MRRVAAPAVAVVAALLAAGCTSSDAPAATQPPSSQAATSSAVSSSSPAPAPGTSSAPAALSAFEADPAVQAIRRWTAEGARTVNAGAYTSKALQSLMTPGLAAEAKLIFGPDVGGYYPGPLPFQPTGVTVTDSTHRTVRGCVENSGWVQNPKTKLPQHPRQLSGVDFQALQQSGRWLVSAFFQDRKVACTGVKVEAPTW